MQQTIQERRDLRKARAKTKEGKQASVSKEAELVYWFSGNGFQECGLKAPEQSAMPLHVWCWDTFGGVPCWGYFGTLTALSISSLSDRI